MRSKKGFTLAELLTVIVILGILLAIAVPSVYQYLMRGTNEYYSSLEDTIMLSGREYLNDYRTLLPREINNVTVVELKELVDNKYIDQIVDSNGDTCTAKLAVKKTGKNEYEYYTCLNCEGDGYLTEGDACGYDESNNVTPDTKNYEVEVVQDTGKYEIDANGVYIVDQGEEFTPPVGKVYYKGQLITGEITMIPKIVDTNILGTTKIRYAYEGAKTEIAVKVVDRVNPSIPQVVLKYDNASGKIYKGGWYSGDIYEEYLSTDYSKSGIVGSGIKNYKLSSDGKTYQTLTGNNHASTENGEYNYYVKSEDKSGNISDVNSYTVMIDKEAPECVLEVKSGTPGKNGWYTSNVTVGFDEENTKDRLSSIVDDTINKTSVTENTTGTTIIATVTDEAGNIGTCKITVKLDKKTSTEITNETKLTINDGITSGNWHKNDTTLTASGVTSTSGVYYYIDTNNPPKTNQNSKQITANTTGTTYYIGACNGAGTCGTATSYVLKLDKTTPPKPTFTASDGIKSGAWHTANFNLTLSGASNISGNTYYYEYNDSTDPSNQYTSAIGAAGETSSYIYYAKICSGAGRCGEVSSYEIKLDKTNPTLSFNLNKSIYNSNQTLTVTASDANYSYMNITVKKNGTTTNNDTNVTSATKSYTLTHGTWEITATAYDKSGRNMTKTATYTIDTSAPTCSLALSGTAGENGWYRSNVTVAMNASNGTGSSVTGTSINQTSFRIDGIYTATGTVTDAAGNVGSCSIPIKKDTIAPSCTNSGDSTSWTSSNRIIYYGCNDGNGSGCNSSYSGGSATFTTSTKATTIAAYTIKDNAGNTTSCPARSANVYVDKSTPTIGAKSSSNYITTSTGAGIPSYFNISYGISGGSVTCKWGSTTVTNTNNLSLGANTVTCTATSGAGLTSSASTVFRHQYTASPTCSGDDNYNSSSGKCEDDWYDSCAYTEEVCVYGCAPDYKCDSTCAAYNYTTECGDWSQLGWYETPNCPYDGCSCETYYEDYGVLKDWTCCWEVKGSCKDWDDVYCPGECSDCYTTKEECVADSGTDYYDPTYSCPQGGTRSGTTCSF